MSKDKDKKKVKDGDVDPGLGFSPYQQQKGMAYSKSAKDKLRQERRKTKQDLKKGTDDE